MQAMQKGMTGGGRYFWRLRWPFAAARPALVAGLALSAAACGSTVGTPLPDLRTAAPTSLTQAERAKSVEELERVRANHEREAEQQIEQSR